MTLPLTARTRLLTLRRLLALAVLVVIALLYVGPVEKYRRLGTQLDQQRHTLAQLQDQRADLLAEQQALHTRARLVILARQCGWIFPGERPFIVKGAADGDSSGCR